MAKSGQECDERHTTVIISVAEEQVVSLSGDCGVRALVASGLVHTMVVTAADEADIERPDLPSNMIARGRAS